LVVVTFFLWFVGNRQATIIEEQNRIMERQSGIMNGQLVATQTAATAAENAAKAAKESLETTRIIEKPHVFVSEIKIVDLDVGKLPVVRVFQEFWRNSRS